MLVNWFYGGGLRESPFYGSRGTDFVIPLPVSEGIPGVQLVGIKYCGWGMMDMCNRMYLLHIVIICLFILCSVLEQKMSIWRYFLSVLRK